MRTRNKFLQTPTAVITAADPPAPSNADGQPVCAHCGGPRPKPTESRHKADHKLKQGIAKKKPGTNVNHAAIAAAREDPFCSNDCCRSYYGVPDPPPLPRPVRVPRHYRYRDTHHRR
jgi:hypothetical protein